MDLDAIRQAWPAVVHRMGESAPALAATFEGARPVSFDEDRLEIGFPVDSTFNKRKAEAPERRDEIAEAFESVTGQRLTPHYVLLDEGDAGAPAAPTGPGPEDDHDALMKRLKSEFDAEEVG